MSIDINTAWEELRKRVENCQGCELCKTRRKTVFGSGNINSRIVIIGEAPGTDEDAQGMPFIGKAGQMLTKILENGGGILRSSVFITNIVKCWPPPTEENKSNGKPSDQQILACREFLEAQLLLLRPEVIVTMGNYSTEAILSIKTKISYIRGTWFDWRGIKVLPMFHPSYLLPRKDASQEELDNRKRLTWCDILELRKKIKELGFKEMLIDGGEEDTNTPSYNS